MMKLYIQVLIGAMLLAGCTQPEAKPQEKVVKASSSIEVVEVEDMPIVPLRTAEEFSLEDKRVGIEPKVIEIPSLDVKAPIEEVGRLDNGQMGVPQDPDQAGWFSPGTKPGGRGSAVIAGHVDSKTGPAIFYELDKMKIGDEVLIHGEDGEMLRFAVVKKVAYPRTDAPVDEIFGFTYGSGLNLITCTGSWDRKAKTHDDRLVVYTELVEGTE